MIATVHSARGICWITLWLAP